MAMRRRRRLHNSEVCDSVSGISCVQVFLLSVLPN